MTICIVNGIRPQNPSPKYCTRSPAGQPNANPAMKTMTTAESAKTNASGIQRSDQPANAEPQRARYSLPIVLLLRPTLDRQSLFVLIAHNHHGQRAPDGSGLVAAQELATFADRLGV